jgi:hypothetical protein
VVIGRKVLLLERHKPEISQQQLQNHQSTLEIAVVLAALLVLSDLFNKFKF